MLPVSAILLAISLGRPVSAQSLREQQQLQTQARQQMEDPAFRELIPLLPEQRVRRDERVPIYFPPSPPPLDRPVAHLINPPGRYAAPDELAPFVNEIFYPMLGTRLHTRTLYANVRLELEAYRTSKVVLQREIRAMVDRHRDAEPAVRRQALQEFARIQTPKIAELEETAEGLRRKLVSGSLGWSALRQWHLVDKERRGFSPLEIAMVMRGYAYYKRGLTPLQRQLLREVTIELYNAVDDAAKAGVVLPHLFFSPSPARVLFPDNLPPELSSKVAAYQLKKSQLKKQLYDLVTAYDGAAFGFVRHSFGSLADKQAPVFEELEQLAEEIRIGMAALPREESPPETSPLPPILAYRIANVLRDRVLAERDATMKADAIIARRYDSDVRVRAAYRFTEEGMKVIVLPIREPRYVPPKEEAEIIAKVHAELVTIADTYGRRLAELLNEQETIRREAAEILRDEKRERVDAALIRTNRLALQKENEEAYTDYRIAVFEPGLSPAQRRILFDRAIERLDLPLPRGEIQVSNRGTRW